MSLHGRLVSLIQAQHDQTPKAASSNLVGLAEDEVLKIMFSNIRGRGDDRRGLQLTQGGLAIMSGFFRHYPVSFPNQLTFSSRHVLYLDRVATMPWYADPMIPVTITFFEPGLAMRAKLVGDLDALLTAFSG